MADCAKTALQEARMQLTCSIGEKPIAGEMPKEVRREIREESEGKEDELESFGEDAADLDVLDVMGFECMTPVQAGVIPLFMQNKDVVVEAVTGSGKTLAFVIPIIEKLMRRETSQKHSIGALIISPTRELAQQISSVIDLFLRDGAIVLKHALFIGGTSALQDDIKRYKELRPDIVVGTPGRLEDLVVGRGSSSGIINAKEMEVLVLDEADRLLDMGFTQSLSNILAHLPKQRRTGLFSATMTDALTEIVRAGLRNPVHLQAKIENNSSKDEQRTPITLSIGYILCEPHQKLSQLLRLLKRETVTKFIIYFATCACVDYFFKLFKGLPQLKNFKINSLHGQMKSKKRIANYNTFVNLPPTSKAILLCTDVAARGLDVPDVDFVIQYDPPQDPKVFSHRCGRTARAGRGGKAIVFLTTGREEVYVEFLKIRKIPLQRQPYLLPDGAVYKLDEDLDDTVPKEDTDNERLIEQVRKIILSDRDYHDKGTRAFVSYVRAYSKHEANYIFRMKDLDLGKIAKGFALLQLPKMPELKGSNIEFDKVPIEMAEYKYADKNRETARVKELENPRGKRRKYVLV
ncbi:3616_t:CDS:10 [Paraglomus brasilianum]|uniref:ATP-dependent RNA helicase n=1 Tax=Paraglomus brasilianum TaxID=144538 RepID=A0A9N8W3G9_9GLOM|nr:3616_t:CDS:10 [Paraglomus brasilianum]